MKNSIKSIALKLLFITLVSMLLLSGCSSSDNETKLSLMMDDDGADPMAPSWANPPSAIQAVYEDRYYVTLYWNKVTKNINLMEKTNIAGYKIYKYDNTNTLIGTYVVPANSQSDKQTYVDTDTRTNVIQNTYRYKITAFDSYMRESTPSGTTVVLIQPSNSQAPNFPSNLKVYLDYVAQNATIVWDPVTTYASGETIAEEDLFGYEVYRSGSGVSSDIPVALVENRTYYVDSLDLSKGGSYVYSLKTVLKNGTKSRTSSSVSVNTNSTEQPSTSTELTDAIDIPNAPHFVSVVGPDATGQRTITFEKPVVNTDGNSAIVNVTEYIIYRSLSKEGPYEIFAMMNSNNTSTETFTYTGSTSRFYYYRITARDKYANESPMSGIGSTGINLVSLNKTSATLSLTADNASISNNTGNTIRWAVDTSIDSATSFNVYRALLPQGPYRLISSVAHIPGDPAMEYTDRKDRNDGIAPIIDDYKYYYRITGVNSQGESGPSYYVEGITKTPQLEIFFNQMQVYSSEGTPGGLSAGSVYYDGETRGCLIFNTNGAGDGYTLRFPRVLSDQDYGSFRLELYAEYSGLNAGTLVKMTVYPEDDVLPGTQPNTGTTILGETDIVQSGTTDYSLQNSGPITGYSINVQQSQVNDDNDYFFVRIVGGAGVMANQRIYLEKIVLKP